MNVVLTALVAVCAVALVVVLMSRRTRASEDGVAEFRRQLGALKPDATRPVIGKRSADSDSAGEPDDGA